MSDKPDKDKASTVSARTRFLACCFYALISTSITFFNKAVLAAYDFQSPNLMTLAQIVSSLVFLLTLRRTSYVAFPDITWKMSLKTSPLAISFLGMVLTGLGALKYLNIPMFNALRRATTLFTMWGQSFMGVKEGHSVMLSVWLMVVGALIAAWYDFDFSLIGYILVGLNCAVTAAYLLCIAYFGKQGLNDFGLMYYNNIQSLPLVIILCYFNGDFAVFSEYKYRYNPGFWICFLFQSTLAFLLNYSIFLCTNINSALATSVTGQIKNVATTLLGYFTFGDVTYDPFNVIGLVLGVIASVWYTHLKFQESQKPKQPLLPTHAAEIKEDQGPLMSNHEEAHSEHDQEHSHSHHGHSHATHSLSHGQHGHSHS